MLTKKDQNFFLEFFQLSFQHAKIISEHSVFFSKTKISINKWRFTSPKSYYFGSSLPALSLSLFPSFVLYIRVGVMYKHTHTLCICTGARGCNLEQRSVEVDSRNNKSFGAKRRIKAREKYKIQDVQVTESDEFSVKT